MSVAVASASAAIEGASRRTSACSSRKAASSQGSVPWSVSTRSTATTSTVLGELATLPRAGRQQQQPPHTAVHHPLLEVGLGEHAQRHAVVVVEQGRVATHDVTADR